MITIVSSAFSELTRELYTPFPCYHDSTYIAHISTLSPEGLVFARPAYIGKKQKRDAGQYS